jgi:hypothetical protein
MPTPEQRDRIKQQLEDIEAELHNGHETTAKDLRWTQFWTLTAIVGIAEKVDTLSAESLQANCPAMQAYSALAKRFTPIAATGVVGALIWAIYHFIESGVKLP